MMKQNRRKDFSFMSGKWENKGAPAEMNESRLISRRKMRRTRIRIPRKMICAPSGS
jgi:hypothetical protein